MKYRFSSISHYSPPPTPLHPLRGYDITLIPLTESITPPPPPHSQLPIPITARMPNGQAYSTDKPSKLKQTILHEEVICFNINILCNNFSIHLSKYFHKFET